jgi:hypothetical protein
MNGGKWTTVPELVAYVAAHAAGIVAAYAINPVVFAMLNVGGYRTIIPAAALGLSVTMMVIVLCLFLVIRRVMSEQP